MLFKKVIVLWALVPFVCLMLIFSGVESWQLAVVVSVAAVLIALFVGFEQGWLRA